MRRYLLPTHLHDRRNRFLVLTVFRNAATGWETRPRAAPRVKQTGSDDEDSEVDRDAGLVVSRDDWRAVCAVLVGQREDVEVEVKDKKASGRASVAKRQASGSTRRTTQKQSAGEEPEPRVTRRQTRAAAAETKDRSESPGGGFIAGGSGDDDEEGGFLLPLDDEGGGGFAPASDDEGAEGSGSGSYSDSAPSEPSSESEFGGPSRQRTPYGKAAARDDDSDLGLDEDEDVGADVPLTLTARQEREARMAFALFFPGVDTNDPALATKKIGIREVADAAKVLKERLSTDDVSFNFSTFQPTKIAALRLVG